MPLEPDQWNRLKEIIASALELPVSERDSFLNRECGQDQELFNEANSLLLYSRTEALNSGQRLLKNRYRVLAELGRGGFAITYTAIDQELHNRKVVIKMLSGSNAQEEHYLYRKFQDEIHALSLLEHPNIVSPLDCGRTEENRPFLVMQFVEGQTLRALMNAGPLITCKVISSILRQLGYALTFAHKRGVIHRDVKPENIMVHSVAEGVVHVKLIDFGISTITAGADDMQTRIVGSAAYMAPEQFRGEVSAKSDIFAMGVVAYELLHGKPPFGNGEPMQIMERQRMGRFVDVTGQRAEFDSSVDTILNRALAFDPELRPQDVSSFAADLVGALETIGAQRKQSLSRWMLAGSVAAAVSVLLICLLLFGRQWAGTTKSQPEVAAVLPKSQTVQPKQREPVAPLTLARITFEIADPPGDLVSNGQGIIEMRQRDKFRLHVHAEGSGHLYTFARSLESANFHVLFPSSTANRGLSLLKPNRSTTIPASNWFSFGDTPGTETLALIWSVTPEPVLEEAARYANTKDRGAVPEGPITRRIVEMLSSPNSLKQLNSEFQLAGDKEACGWLTLRHK